MSVQMHIGDSDIRASEMFAEQYPMEEFFAPAVEDAIVIDGCSYRSHPNGGGLVAVTAFVASSVFVAESARVEGNAIVLDRVRILNRAVVAGNAVVTDRCELRGDSRVGGNATLVGMVTLRRHARIDGIAWLEGAIVVDCVAHINRGHLFGPLFIE